MTMNIKYYGQARGTDSAPTPDIKATLQGAELSASATRS